MTQDQAKALKVGDRVMWRDDAHDCGTVASVNDKSFMVRWDDGVVQGYDITHPINMNNITLLWAPATQATPAAPVTQQPAALGVRQWYAGMALQGLLARGWVSDAALERGQSIDMWSVLAEEAFCLAEAMLTAEKAQSSSPSPSSSS